MSIDVNPVIWRPQSPQEWVMCVVVWATVLAFVCMVWMWIEEVGRSPERKRRREYSRLCQWCGVYVAIWFASLCAFGLAMECWPPLAAVMNHFFSTGMRPF
jgi:hypothetical protein